MKRIIILVSIFVISVSVFAQSALDKPAAIVRLTETEVVSAKKVKQMIELLEANAKRVLTNAEKESVLNDMVNSILIVQAAKRDNISLPADQIMQWGIMDMSQKIGRQLNKAQFIQFVEQQTKQPIDLYLKDLEKNLLAQKYISEKGREDFLAISQPTEKEIQDAYMKQEMSYVNPEMKRLSHIFFSSFIAESQNPRMMSSSEKEVVRKKADAVYRNILNGVTTFEEAVRTSSEDNVSKVKAGDISYLTRNHAQTIQMLGEEFVNQVFSMKIGEYKLIESNTGFHIVRITDQIDKKFLKLDDQINPQEQLTVRQFVSQNLLKMKQQKVFVLVTERVIEELKESAEITLYTNNLGW